MEKLESFVFYKSFFDAVKTLPKHEKVMCAILQYVFEGEYPENCPETAKSLATVLLPLILKAKKRYETSVENGRKCVGKTNPGTHPGKTPDPTPATPLNVNVNANENANANENENGGACSSPDVSPSLSLLKRFPFLRNDEQLLKDCDADKLSEEIGKSDFLLRGCPAAQSVSWLNKHMDEILSGKYRNFAKPPTVPVPRPASQKTPEYERILIPGDMSRWGIET